MRCSNTSIDLGAGHGIPTYLQGVAGSRELLNWFGYWPSFHDAEVISLTLNRRGASCLLLYTWEMTEEINERGQYILTNTSSLSSCWSGSSTLS